MSPIREQRRAKRAGPRGPVAANAGSGARAWAIIAVSLVFAWALPGSAAATIVYDDGDGGIHAINDNGTGEQPLVRGAGIDPAVSPQGSTVILIGNEPGEDYFGTVEKWSPGGSPSVLAQDFDGYAAGPEIGTGSRYVFEVGTKFWGGNYTTRQGTLSSKGSTKVNLFPAPPPPSAFAPFGWDVITGDDADPRQASPSPTQDKLLYVGPGGRRCASADCGTIYVEDIEFLMLVTPQSDQPLLYSESLWQFQDPSWSADGTKIVFRYFTHTLATDPVRPGEGIWVADSDGENLRQVLQEPDPPGPLATPITDPRLGGGRVIFEYHGAGDQLSGIYSVPASCSECTMEDATFLAEGHNPFWTSASFDTTAPKTTITGQPKSRIRTSKSKVRVTVSFRSEKGATFGCELDSAGYRPCRSPYSVIAKSKGGRGMAHTISIKATDKAGNTGKAATVRFRVIRTA